MKLYFSRNYNPRLAVAVARYLEVPVTFEFAAPLAPGEQDRFRPLNPNLRVPILVDGDHALWEADAIACRLSRLAGSEFWRSGGAEPEMIRWLSWGMWNFVDACDKIHFERVTKRRYAIGPTDESAVAQGLAGFAAAATLLDAHLEGRTWLLGETISYADFRMASVLPYRDVAGLPVAAYRHLAAWNARLEGIPAWNAPFLGLDAPELPPVRA